MSRLTMLEDYLAEVRTKRFRPSVHDCAAYVAGWIERVTGVDLMAEWRGQYRTIEDGKAMLQEQGYADHAAVVAERFEEIPPAMARTGDVAVVDGEALGVFSSDRVFVLHPDGLASVNRLRATRAFRL